MRISKFLPLTFAAVFFVGSPVRADDTAAQAAARAALLQKMQEMNDQPAGTTPAPVEAPAPEAPAVEPATPAPAKAKPAKAKKPKKAKTPPPVAVEPAAPV